MVTVVEHAADAGASREWCAGGNWDRRWSWRLDLGRPAEKTRGKEVLQRGEAEGTQSSPLADSLPDG